MDKNIDSKIDKAINKIPNTAAAAPPQQQQPKVEKLTAVLPCPYCNTNISVTEELVKTGGQCPKCNNVFDLKKHENLLIAFKRVVEPVKPAVLSQEALNKLVSPTQQYTQTPENQMQQPQQQYQQPQQQQYQQPFQQQPQQQNQHIKKIPENLVEKRLAAQDLLHWLNSYKRICILAIVAPVIIWAMAIIYLDIFAILVIVVIAFFSAFQMRKIVGQQLYLSNKYNIPLTKKTIRINRNRPMFQQYQQPPQQQYNYKQPPQQPFNNQPY